jgi:CxxC motif-containing protein (DUF1111 family)
MAGRRRPNLSAVLLALAVAAPALAGEAEVRRGKLLFGAPWIVPAGQDALGPLLNARACADCHPGGAAGAPGGPALVLRTGGDPQLGQQIQPLAVDGVAVEPVPRARTAMVATGGEQLPATFWSGERPLAARLAPGLRGAGLLALIPDAVLRRAADPADADGDGVSGRPGAGRFGYKAEHATLAAAVETALVVDMGLATPSHPRPAGDCTPAQPACLAAAGHGAPVPALAVERLVAFVAALRPRPAEGTDAAGARLFAAAGCAACHAGPYVITSDPAVTGRTVESIAPYTDLLLHDLGPELADPFPSPHAAAGEWRTAPLWGLRAKAAFLHDGRAGSLRDAILWHGGEASGSRARFLALAPEERAALLRFLLGL